MPLPKPHSGETEEDFIGRCMGDSNAGSEFPDQAQRHAYCNRAWESKETDDAPAPIASAIATTLGPGLPDSIQWMPPGEHDVVCMFKGEPTRLKVKVDEETARVMQAVLETFLERARANAGDRPYFDFNHEDREASAHPTEFFWAGDDPIEGGVRVRLQWTEPGRQAVMGRAYRRFSPSFVPDQKAGRVRGSALNMGGLVNRAAFPSIQPIWSKDGHVLVTEPAVRPPEEGGARAAGNHGGKPPIEDEPMEEMKRQVAELATAIGKINEGLAAIQSAQAKQGERLDAIQADVASAKGEHLAIETRLNIVEQNHVAKAKEHAAELVRQAVEAGKIPPQNAELIQRWTDLVVADAKNAQLLEQLPENPALKKIVQMTANAKAAAAPADAEAFAKAVQAEVTAGKTKSEALRLVMAKQPDLHTAWLKAGGEPKL